MTATTPTPCVTRAWRATRAAGRSCCRSASASGLRDPLSPTLSPSRPERARAPAFAERERRWAWGPHQARARSTSDL
eukprot:3216997-Prymnesium_polylepis.1